MYYPFSIRLFLTVILGFWLFDGYAQKLPLIQIDITATNAFKGTYLFISICSYEDVTKIVYKVKDSLDNKGLKSDTQYMTLEKYRKEVIDTERNVDPALKLMQKFAEISKKHTHYSMDSVLVSTKSTPLYTKLLNKVANISTDSLENSKANINGMQPIVKINVCRQLARPDMMWASASNSMAVNVISSPESSVTIREPFAAPSSSKVTPLPAR